MASKAYKRLVKKIPKENRDKVKKEIDYLDNQAKELKKLIKLAWTETDTNGDFFMEIANKLINKGVRVKK